MAVWPLPRITFRELSSLTERRPVALLTTEAVWTVLSAQLSLPVLIQAEPERYDWQLFEYLADNLPSRVQAVYAVGDGAPVEAAKIIAARNDLPLTIVPTALSSLRMFQPFAVGEEKNELGFTRLTREETGSAREIVIDWGVIQAAPEATRGAGLADVLSIITGLLDWRYAAQKGKNPREQRFMAWAASVATALVKQAIKSAGAVGQGNREALHTLLNLMALAAQLNNQLGHTRAQQGGEHYLTHILAELTHFDVPHAAAVGQCLLFVAALHGQDVTPLRNALQQAGVPLDRVRPTDFALALDHLEAYLVEYEFPYSILNDVEAGDEKTQAALQVAGLQIQPQTWEKPGASAPRADAEAVSPVPEETMRAETVYEDNSLESTPPSGSDVQPASGDAHSSTGPSEA